MSNDPTTRSSYQPSGWPDPTRSQATQPYRASKAAQDAARKLTQGLHPSVADVVAPFLLPASELIPLQPRCPRCKTSQATQADADACCQDTHEALEIGPLQLVILSNLLGGL